MEGAEVADSGRGVGNCEWCWWCWNRLVVCHYLYSKKMVVVVVATAKKNDGNYQGVVVQPMPMLIVPRDRRIPWE